MLILCCCCSPVTIWCVCVRLVHSVTILHCNISCQFTLSARWCWINLHRVECCWRWILFSLTHFLLRDDANIVVCSENWLDWRFGLTESEWRSIIGAGEKMSENKKEKAPRNHFWLALIGALLSTLAVTKLRWRREQQDKTQILRPKKNIEWAENWIKKKNSALCNSSTTSTTPTEQ